MQLRINPFNRGNPMSLKDAAIVSGLAALATYFLSFLVNIGYAQVKADLAAFAFESIKCLGSSFFGTLMALLGLEQLIRRAEEKQPSPG